MVGAEDIRPEVSRVDAVRHHGARSLCGYAQASGVVCTGDKDPILGKRADELLERLHHVLERRIEVGVVELDVRDDRGLRCEVEERPVALISFRHHKVGPTKGHVAPYIVELTTNQRRRVLTESLQYVRRHACRRRLAVRTSYGDTAVALQDPGQRRRAGYYGHRTSSGFEDLWVCLWYGGGDDDLVGVAHLIRSVPDVDGDARVAQPAGVGRLLEVGSREFVSSTREDLRNAAHPGPSDADHVYLHGPYSLALARNSFSATSPAAWGVARLFIRCAICSRRPLSSSKPSTRRRSNAASTSASGISSAAPLS